MICMMSRQTKAGIPERRQMHICNEMHAITIACSHSHWKSCFHQVLASMDVPRINNWCKRQVLVQHCRYQLHIEHMCSRLCSFDTCLLRILRTPEYRWWEERALSNSISQEHGPRALGFRTRMCLPVKRYGGLEYRRSRCIVKSALSALLASSCLNLVVMPSAAIIHTFCCHPLHTCKTYLHIQITTLGESVCMLSSI